jgi:acid phosphatase family membrane protein YuiD
MYLGYLITPFLTWLLAGGLKFLINCIRSRRLAFDLIGYGGLPSNHSAIVSSAVALVALREGIHHPAFGIGLTLAFIVMLDAKSLRREVGKHAQAINRLDNDAITKPLRERMGHSAPEILSGVIVGVVAALLVDFFLSATT